jgi:DNA end-binding protein Ku
MPARPYWSGQIRLSLVTFAVDLFSATRAAAAISFNQIHKPSGKRVHYEKVVEGVGPVDRDEIVKGYQYEKGHYVLLTDDELEQVKLESKKTLELSQFVAAGEIDPIYFDRPYFVVPQDDLAEEAFRVVRDALRQTGKIGLGQITLRGREYIAALKPCGPGMVLETLRYPEELQKAAPYFRSISSAKSEKDALDLAETIIARRSGPFAPETFKDHYGDALRALIKRKMSAKGGKLETEPEAPHRHEGADVIDLMAALRKSVGEKSSPASRAGKAGAKAPAKRRVAAKANPQRRKRAAR